MLEVRATGAAAPGLVWDRYTRTDLWPVWAPQIRGVDGVRGTIAAGDRGRVRGPGPVRVPFEILDVEPTACTWSWRVGLGPAAVVMDHGVDVDDRGTTAWLRVHVPRLLLIGYVPVAKWALARLVAPSGQR